MCSLESAKFRLIYAYSGYSQLALVGLKSNRMLEAFPHHTLPQIVEGLTAQPAFFILYPAVRRVWEVLTHCVPA